MALNRAWVNSLTNVSSPTATDGSVWAKESVIHVYDDVDAAIAPHGAQLQCGPKPVGAGWQTLPVDVAEFNTDAGYVTGVGTFRIPANMPGVYLISAYALWGPDASHSLRILQIQHNAAVIAGPGGDSGSQANTLSCMFYRQCAGGDLLGCYCYQVAAATISEARFSLFRI